MLAVPSPTSIPLLAYKRGFPGGSDGKESACSAGSLGSVPGSEDPLEKGMATHSSIVAREFQRQKNLASYSPRDHRQSDRTERLTVSLSLSFHISSILVQFSSVSQSLRSSVSQLFATP